jgi:hypothetical protein
MEDNNIFDTHVMIGVTRMPGVVIDQEDLYDTKNHNDRIVKYPHVTLLARIDNTVSYVVLMQHVFDNLDLIPGLLNIEPELSVFENEEYDVLKMGVPVDGFMKALRESMITKFNNKQTFDTWEPHITVAYLKKGTFTKYMGKSPMSTMITTDVTISYPDKRISISI